MVTTNKKPTAADQRRFGELVARGCSQHEATQAVGVHAPQFPHRGGVLVPELRSQAAATAENEITAKCCLHLGPTVTSTPARLARQRSISVMSIVASSKLLGAPPWGTVMRPGGRRRLPERRAGCG